ncbi:MAG: diguanylate cyclase [Lachnospiraceae bacterium]|nr:diguanylate cyclase [Lachnospiraceae bacterium]
MSSQKKEHHSIVDNALGTNEGAGFEETLTSYLSAANAEIGDNIHLVLIDLDHFMEVNNKFGFDEGDHILIETGKHLKKYAEENGGEFFRISGDEFGIIFKGSMEKEDVFLLMEDMRKNYDQKTPDGANCTICIGISTAFENANRFQELFRMAESAMFRSKYNGRNKVALAKEEKMIPKTSHYTQDQLKRLTELAKREGVGEAILLREAMDMLLKKYDI